MVYLAGFDGILGKITLYRQLFYKKQGLFMVQITDCLLIIFVVYSL